VVLRSATTSDEEHGSLKLAVDGNRDGSAEPASTRDASVVAAHDGVVQIAHDTWPGGTQVVIDGREGWRSLYSHLASVAVEPGQHVTPGQLLGRAGNSGRAAGPQLGIQIWHDGQVSDASRLLPCGS
jgi:murein DD-endopeptidase MepM/ murein hydrolase activator NlpD